MIQVFVLVGPFGVSGVFSTKELAFDFVQKNWDEWKWASNYDGYSWIEDDIGLWSMIHKNTKKELFYIETRTLVGPVLETQK